MMQDYDELYDLLLKFTDENVHSMVDWVIDYRMKHVEEQGDASLNDHLEKLIVLSADAAVCQGGKFLNKFEILRNHYLENVYPLINSGFRSEIALILSEKRFDLLAKISHQIISNNQKHRPLDLMYDKWRKDYISDPELLIEKITEILKAEYEERIQQTKKALQNYLQPHKAMLEKLEFDIKNVEKALVEVDLETRLSDADKKMIKETLQNKLAEMQTILNREHDNIVHVRAFIEEIKEARAKFSEMINILSAKNEQVKTRKNYLVLIQTLDATVPVLDSIFHELSNDLKNEMQNIRDAFFVLNRSIQASVLESIDKNASVAAILGTSCSDLTDRLGEKALSLEGSVDLNYDIDLDFLDR